MTTNSPRQIIIPIIPIPYDSMTQLPNKSNSSINSSQNLSSFSSFKQNTSSMEIMCSSINNIIIPRVQIKKRMSKAIMIHKNRLQSNKASASLIKPPLTIKVFEDQAKGILCYKDENGELTCEGCDEGPRFIRQPTKKKNYYHPRCTELQVSDFLTQRWIQILQDQN